MGESPLTNQNFFPTHPEISDLRGGPMQAEHLVNNRIVQYGVKELKEIVGILRLNRGTLLVNLVKFDWDVNLFSIPD